MDSSFHGTTVDNSYHNRPAFDDDCANLIMAYLPPSTLATVAQTSRWGNLLVGPHLTRDVHLSRSSTQVVDFCRYTLTKGLVANIKKLHIEGHAIDDSTECARALSFLLKRTCNLRSFFRSTTPDSTLVEWSRPPFFNRMTTEEPSDVTSAPHPLLVQALQSHPPSERLSLSLVPAPQLAALSSMDAGLCRLRSLSLTTEFKRPWNLEVDPAQSLTRLLDNFADSLTELTLIGTLPPTLFEGTKDPPILLLPHVRSLRLEFRREYGWSWPTDPKLSLQRVATAFPGLRHLSANSLKPRNEPDFSDDWRDTLPADLPLVALKTRQDSIAKFATVQLSHVHFSTPTIYNGGDNEFGRAVRPFKAQLRGIIVGFHCHGTFISLLEWLNGLVGHARFLHLLVAMELEPSWGIKDLTQSIADDINTSTLADLKYFALDLKLRCPVLGASPVDVENLQRVIAQIWLRRNSSHPSSKQCVCVETSVHTHLRYYDRQWWVRRPGSVSSASRMEIDGLAIGEMDVDGDGYGDIMEVGEEEGLRLRREHMGPLVHLL